MSGETTVLTRERAVAIWDNRPEYGFQCSDWPERDMTEAERVWMREAFERCPGHWTYADLFFAIKNAFPLPPKVKEMDQDA